MVNIAISRAALVSREINIGFPNALCQSGDKLPKVLEG